MTETKNPAWTMGERRVIWKYDLNIDLQTIRMPASGVPVHVGLQRPETEQIQMWVLVNDTEPFADRTFAVIGTGRRAPGADVSTYIGTVLDGLLVWHVFEIHG